MSNKSQTGLGYVDFSITGANVTGSPQLLMAENQTRGALEIMNNGTATGFIYFAPIGSKAAPVSMGANVAGSYPLVVNGSFEPQGGGIPLNAIWWQGTNGSCVSACQSQP